MKKVKFISVGFIMLLSLVFSSVAHAFTDVPGNHNFKKEIDHLVQLGAINGYQNGTFNPSGSVTRGQAAKIITIALDMPLVNPASPTFKDIPKSHNYYQQIETLAAKGVINGYPNGTFGSGNPVKRSHMAKIIANSLELTEMSSIYFTDVSMNNEFYPYINKLATAGITTGRPDGTFGMNSNVNRGQMAAFVSRGVESLEAVDDPFWYRQVHFGMSRAQVKASEEGSPTIDDQFRVVYEGVEHGDYIARIEYSFTDNKLDMMSFSFDVSHVRFGESAALFKSLVEDVYEPQFFTPYSVVDEWEDLNGNEFLTAYWDVDDNILVNLQMSTGYGRDSVGLNFSIHQY